MVRFAHVVVLVGGCTFSTALPRETDIDAPVVDGPPIDTEACATTSVGTCPTNYVLVPNNCAFNANEFCIAKYEMKMVGGIATSQPGGIPWGTITTAGARAACAALGSRYHLVRNDEWMATARAIEATPENWSLTTTPFLSKGKTENCVGPCPQTMPSCPGAAAMDNNPCLDTLAPNCANRMSTDFRYNRTHRIFGNGVIWDLAGNMFELVDHPATRNAMEGMGTGQDINSSDGGKFSPPLTDAQYKSANSSHTDQPTVARIGQPAVQNIGILFVTSPTDAPNFTRGGDFCSFAGIYSVALLRDSEMLANVGFRCVYK